MSCDAHFMMGMPIANDSLLSLPTEPFTCPFSFHCAIMFYLKSPMLASHGAALNNSLMDCTEAQFSMQSTEPRHHKFQV